MDVRRFLPPGADQPPVSGAYRTWCKQDPWVLINGIEYVFVAYGLIDPALNEVDGPVEWTFHLRAGDTFEVEGTWDEFGHGETTTVAHDVDANHSRRVDVKIPVLNAIATERLFEVWIGTELRKDQMVGDHLYAGNLFLFDESDAAPPPEIGAAGTRWGGPYNPGNK